MASDRRKSCPLQASIPGFIEEEGLSQSEASNLFVRSIELADEARSEFWERHCSSSTDVEDSRPSHTDGSGRVIVGGRHRPLVAFSCGAYGATLADGSEFSGGVCMSSHRVTVGQQYQYASHYKAVLFTSGNYSDNMTEEELMSFHRSRLEPIKGNFSVDALAFETIPCLKVCWTSQGAAVH